MHNFTHVSGSLQADDQAIEVEPTEHGDGLVIRLIRGQSGDTSTYQLDLPRYDFVDPRGRDQAVVDFCDQLIGVVYKIRERNAARVQNAIDADKPRHLELVDSPAGAGDSVEADRG